MNRPNLVTSMRRTWFVILMVAACAGCGSEIDKDVVPGQNECAGETSVFTYALLPPPESVSVASFAVDDVNIYFTDTGTWSSSGYNNDGRIMKIPLEGGEPVTLATGEIFPLHIAVNDTHIYWSTQSAVRMMPLAGSAPMALASDTGSPQGIAIDKHYVYWTTNLSRLMRASIDGAEVTELVDGSATSFAFTGLALDATHIYWASRGDIDLDNGSLMKMPIEGGPITTLATGQSEPSRIAVDATDVYWTNVGDFNANVGLMKVPVDGGALTTVVSTQSQSYAQYAAVAGVFVDANNLYWTVRGSQEYDHYDGTVMKMPVEGGAPTTLVSAVRSAQESIIDRGCHVYFAAGGNLHRIDGPF